MFINTSHSGLQRIKLRLTRIIGSGAIVCFLFLVSHHAKAQDTDEQTLIKWAKEFEPSTVAEPERINELRWFREAAKEFKGKKIKSVAEDIKVHFWERDVLTKAFEEITGIKVEHEIIGEGTLVERIMEQIEKKKELYDIFVNDSDLKGTHLRTQGVVLLDEYMKSEGKAYTNPNLDLEDFLNLEFGQDYDKHQLQLADQQFANLYWFRYDWFTRPDIMALFKKKYGYELGVPINWAAYEDIAEFFNSTPIDGKRVYGHMDFGKKSPSLGWRFTDAWLSIAGGGDKGLPNGSPVDEWGIRVENRIPVGSSVERGGDTNGPAAVYALTKYVEWLNKYAPEAARKGTIIDNEVMAGRGNIAQQIFFYTYWLSWDDYHKLGSPVVGKDGKPLWRVAPTPHGRYWEEGMKVGYTDAGSWTIPISTTGPKRAASWLWAQFCVSKTVSLKKFLVGATPNRKSTVFSAYLTEHKDEWGGLIDFYRSPEENKWTDTGLNVPHYPLLSREWWPNLDKAISGEFTPQQAMDTIAKRQDEIMGQLKLAKYSPQLNEPKPKEFWLKPDRAPKIERPNREKPLTIPYDELIKRWQR